MSTVSSTQNSPLGALHEAFSDEQIAELRDDDLSAGYRVAAVLISFIALGCIIGTLGVWIATI